MSDVVLYETRGPAAWITLNRPEKLNALNGPVLEALHAAFDRAVADDEVKVVVLAGAGELAMACDIIVSGESGRFGEPEIRYGSGPVTLLMPFILGQKKTNELLFTGDMIDAEAAERAGMINRVVADDELDAEVEALVRKIAPTPLPVLRLTKIALVRAYEAMGLREAVNINLDLSSMLNAADAPEQREFMQIVQSSGLKAALAWRDNRYGEVLGGVKS